MQAFLPSILHHAVIFVVQDHIHYNFPEPSGESDSVWLQVAPYPFFRRASFFLPALPVRCAQRTASRAQYRPRSRSNRCRSPHFATRSNGTSGFGCNHSFWPVCLISLCFLHGKDSRQRKNIFFLIQCSLIAFQSAVLSVPPCLSRYDPTLPADQWLRAEDPAGPAPNPRLSQRSSAEATTAPDIFTAGVLVEEPGVDGLQADWVADDLAAEDGENSGSAQVSHFYV